MRFSSYFCVALLFTLVGSACGGRIQIDEFVASGGASVGTGGASTILQGIGGAPNVPALTTTGGTNAVGTLVAIGGATLDTVMVINSFDTSSQGDLFVPLYYEPTDCTVNAAAANDAGAMSQIEWTVNMDCHASSTGHGSLKITARFTDWNQFIDVQMSVPTDAYGYPLDLTNKIVSAKIQINQGLAPDPNYPYGAVLYLKTGVDYTRGESRAMDLDSIATWVTLVLFTSSPQGVPAGHDFDPAHPMLLGVRFGTGSGGESMFCARDYKSAFGPPRNTVVYIDEIQVSDRI